MASAPESPVPRAWFDLDGTIIQIVSGVKNMTKSSRMPLIEGIGDFAQGVREGCVSIDGIVTRRRPLWRTGVTRRTVNRYGLREMLGQDIQVKLMSDEPRKGAFLVARSLERPIGMVEDRPQKLGGVLLGALAAERATPDTNYSITIGVVPHDSAAERIEELSQAAMALRGVEYAENDYGGFVVRGETFPNGLHVVALGGYTRQEGQIFAQTLYTHAG